MTVIEFLHKSHIKNMVSCLTLRPKKVIFLGDADKAKKRLKNYSLLVEEKNLPTTLSFEGISQNRIDSIVAKLSKIVEAEKDCVFDLTGGEDLALVAMGIVYEKYKNTKKIQMHRFNINTGRLIDCDNDGEVYFAGKPEICVKDQIMLHGGRITKGDVGLTTKDPSVLRDIDKIWSLCKADSNTWNRNVGHLLAFEKHKCVVPGELDIRILFSVLKYNMKNYAHRLSEYCDFLKVLSNDGLITDFSITEECISYSHKSKETRACFEKEGNILEHKIMLIAKKCVTEQGEPLFNDALRNMEIDWDGRAVNPNGQKDTRNEIDVFLMKGLVPIFISCKNGQVEEEELYKLQTVAARFGGEHAKKILVATDIPMEAGSLSSFTQRAINMGISVIDDAKKLSDTDMAQLLTNIVTH